MVDDNRELHWSAQLEDLIAQEGEKCRGLGWLHQHSEMIMSKRNTYLMMPTIVLSTLCGTLSVSGTALFGECPLSNVIIGFVSIFVVRVY
jgi:hypothetical protein